MNEPRNITRFPTLRARSRQGTPAGRAAGGSALPPRTASARCKPVVQFEEARRDRGLLIPYSRFRQALTRRRQGSLPGAAAPPVVVSPPTPRYDHSVSCDLRDLQPPLLPDEWTDGLPEPC